MKEQILILVDDNDREIGSAPRSVCHAGEGKRHRAFVVLLINRDGEVLLQHRKNVKLGGERWDGSAISHVLVGENYESAARRSIKHELNINYGKPFTDCGAFVYEEHYGSDSENEYCKVLVGEWNGDFIPNMDEMTEAKFMQLKGNTARAMYFLALPSRKRGELR